MSITESELTTYLCMLPDNNREKKSIAKNLREFSDKYLDDKDYPDESEILEYAYMLSRKAHDRQVGEKAAERIRAYFSQKKGATEMSEIENENKILGKEIKTENEEANSQDNNLEKAESEERTSGHGQAESEEKKSQDRILGKERQPKRIGRRKKENGIRDYKVNLYLTQSMADDIRALSALRGIDSLPEYIITVLSKEIEAKAEKLRMFRELKESERE